MKGFQIWDIEKVKSLGSEVEPHILRVLSFESRTKQTTARDEKSANLQLYFLDTSSLYL